tara:strand:- start:1028 stop:1435 length:408 start_codon:yes stop_codon:yes gene_type:complete
MIFLNKYPSIKLDSGIRIVNYSSPHTYKFHTGEELPACSNEVAQDTKLEAHHSKVYNDNGWLDVSINYALSELQVEELAKLADFDVIDIILIPYPVMTSIKDQESPFWDDVYDKVRVCKLHDRVTKVIRSDEFCV